MKKFINYFLQGLLYIVPLTVTMYVVVWTFKKIDGILPFQFPGLGLIIIIALITIIGFVGSAVIASPINSFFQNLLKRAPLLQTIYSSVKDLMNTFVGKKKGFSQPVLIKLYENSTIERIGFITNDDLNKLEKHFKEIGRDDIVCVRQTDKKKEKVLIFCKHDDAPETIDGIERHIYRIIPNAKLKFGVSDINRDRCCIVKKKTWKNEKDRPTGIYSIADLASSD